MTKEYEIHPLANLLPPMTDEEFNDLVADIKKNGLIEPITIYEDKILEGRHRYKACEKLGGMKYFSTPHTYRGDDPLGYVMAKNVHRRHLTPKQRREVIAAALKMNPEKSNREIAKSVKQDHKTVAKVRKEQEHVGTIPHIKHPNARKTPNKPMPAPVPLAEVRIVESPEVSIEDRKAQNVALDVPQEDRAFAEFKVACNIWLPKMTPEQIEAACDILLAALSKIREAA
jgi:ParB-like nuclease family protein